MTARTRTTAAAPVAAPPTGAADASTSSPTDERSAVRRGGSFGRVLAATHEASDPSPFPDPLLVTDPAVPGHALVPDTAVLPTPTSVPDVAATPDPALVAAVAASTLPPAPGPYPGGPATPVAAPVASTPTAATPGGPPVPGSTTPVPAGSRRAASGVGRVAASSGPTVTTSSTSSTSSTSAPASGATVAGAAAPGPGPVRVPGPAAPGVGRVPDGVTVGAIGGVSTTITLSADQVGSGTADGTPDLPVAATTAATVTSRPPGAPVSTTTSWFGLDVTIAGDPTRPAGPTATADGTLTGAAAPSLTPPSTAAIAGAAVTITPVLGAPPGLTTAAVASAAVPLAALPSPAVASAAVPSPALPSPAGGPTAVSIVAAANGAVLGARVGADPGSQSRPDRSSGASDADPASPFEAPLDAGLVAAGPTPLSGERPATPAAAVPVGEQVARQINAIRTTADGTHRTVVRLDPEHLGPIALTVSVRAGRVRLSVSGSPQALAALEASMNDLRDQLGSAGLGLDGVSLQPTTAGGSSSSSTDGRAGSGAAFAATTDTAGDGGRRAPEGRPEPGGPEGSDARSGTDVRGARGAIGTSDADPGTPQPLPHNGFGVAVGVDVRV